jgi:hypothetical protein
MNEMPLPEGRLVVERLASGLARTVHAPIRCFDDWHAHDGFVSSSKSTTWPEIHELISSDHRLRSWLTDDTWVMFTVYATNGAFCLRFGYSDEVKPPALNIDISGDNECLRMAEQAATNWEQEELAADYFQRIYRG